ncbi:hypothetical protein KW850_25570 [Bacillus sp. sid0103]|uniref:hypothetical protein n=2 Tax=unclassified Bacillus (in: firmicutes) TaxID=185979 RepID=UPI000BFB80C1|nr:hypothetical protein [Bacillus sp. AFS031507]MBV7508589.1 hypothetical protein [Bacillus sp. sid0103]PGY07306.1 hypothetical protein COE25_24615 [Bacillus sp. AFS031507]
MKTCAYCGSPVKFLDKYNYYCYFCTMKLKYEDVQENGKRKNLLPSSQPSLSDLNKSTPELMCLSTVELLFLLKFARKERSDLYHRRYIFIRAMKEGAGGFTEAEEYTFSEYEKVTRKCFVLENLVRERLGYYPTKLTESYIQTLVARMEESAKKDMVIQEAKPIKS